MPTTHTFRDTAASVITSAYKWLTSTLYSAQQQFTVHPFFTAQILDDTIQPNAQLFSGAGEPLGKSSMAIAPDGTAYAVGLDGSNNLCVYKAPDLNAVAGVFPTKITLTTTGDNFLDARNNYAISISDYYQGLYRICVWYFGNFLNDGTDLKVILQYSDDGGNTWTKVTFSPSSLPNNSLGNISIAAMKPVFTAGAMQNGCFYLKKNSASFASGFTGYDVYYIYGNGTTTAGYSRDIPWAQQNVNSFDWTLHSLASFYFNGVHHLVFTGFRNIIDNPGINANYSLWVAQFLRNTGSSVTDLWSAPNCALAVNSALFINQNSLMYPTAVVNNGMVNIVAQATMVDSVSQTSAGNTEQIVTTHTNYMLFQSDNGLDYSYPSVLVGTDNSEFNNSSYASFALQGSYWYLLGNGYIWQLIQNAIVADVSEDIIGYQIQEQAGQPSALNLQIANANNKWVGANPTGAGAAAIKRNRKISIWQGYYNANGVAELIPHSLHYIDDIKQIITGTKNDVTLIARDLYKKLKTTITKFTYQFVGPVLFSDIFDGSFTSQWNQIAGTWTFGTITPPILNLAVRSGGTEDKIMLVSTNSDSYGHFMRIFFRNNGASFVYFYAFYIDDNNWLRLEINCSTGNTFNIVKCINGVTSTIDTGTMPFTMSSTGSHYYGVYIRRYNYFTWTFMIDALGDTLGNTLQDYDPGTTSYLFKGSTTGEFDLSGTFNTTPTWQKPFTVGIGSANSGGVGPSSFRWFMFTQYNQPTELGGVIRRLARIAGIFTFKIKYAWRELLYTPNFSGTFSVKNRIITLTAGNQAMSQDNQPFADGEITFAAKIDIANSANPAGFSFIFRRQNDSSGDDDYYKFHVICVGGVSTPPIQCRFERYQALTGVTYRFYNTAYDVSNNPAQFAPVSIDVTQTHIFRIFMINGWMYAFIDDIFVAAFNDNTTFGYQTTGKWGFEADSNSTLHVSDILAPDFWKPVPNFSFNPGDDAENAIDSLVVSLRAWFFSDLLGRFKTIFLSSNNQSTYTYQNQLFNQSVDQSDKEYVSQVTVYGNGVIATARDTSLMPGVPVREEVIVDYTITTFQDAQTRANNELINANQYIGQYTPKQVINVGSELFDAVTVINTGNNTSGIDSPTRVYAQNFSQGGGDNNGDYSLEIDTGNL